MPPRFSVVIAAYRAADTLGEAIESALHQTSAPHEVIVVDDASPDDQRSIAAAFGDRVTYIRRDVNGGVAAAKNTGVEAATGDWIALLDADDAYEPERLARIGDLADRTTATLITTDAWVGDAGRRYYHGPGSAEWPDRDQRQAILNGNFVFGAAAVPRSAWVAVGGMDERDRTITDDWPLWVRMLLAGHRPALVDEPLYHYRLRDDSEGARWSSAFRTARAVALIALDHPEATDTERRLARDRLGELDRVIALHTARQRLWAGERSRSRFARVALDRRYPKAERLHAVRAALLPSVVRRRMAKDPDLASR